LLPVLVQEDGLLHGMRGMNTQKIVTVEIRVSLLDYTCLKTFLVMYMFKVYNLIVVGVTPL